MFAVVGAVCFVSSCVCWFVVCRLFVRGCCMLLVVDVYCLSVLFLLVVVACLLLVLMSFCLFVVVIDG